VEYKRYIPFPPTSRPQTTPSSILLKIDKFSNRHGLYLFLLVLNQIQSSKHKNFIENLEQKHLKKTEEKKLTVSIATFVKIFCRIFFLLSSSRLMVGFV